MGPHFPGRVRIRLDQRMMPRRHRRPLALALVCAATACAPDESDRPGRSPGTISLTDAADTQLSLTEPATRVVSLVPSATATLRAIGAESVLAGRTDFDTGSWAAGIPSVGGGIEPSVEMIVSLEPDLVVGFAGDQDPRTRERVEELGIPYLAVRPDRIEDIFETARLLGRVTGFEAAADSLVGELRAGLDSIADAVAAWPRHRVAYVLGGGSPPWVSGRGTYIAEVLSLVGGDNVFDDIETLYSAISPEELRARDIDVVLVAVRGEYDETLTPDSRIVEIGSVLELPGPGVVEAARRVAGLLHGRPLP